MSIPRVSMRFTYLTEDSADVVAWNADGTETTYTLVNQLSTIVPNSTAIVRPPPKVWVKDLAHRTVVPRESSYVVEGTYMVVGTTHVLV